MNEVARKNSEIAHGKKIAESAGSILFRDTLAGQRRVQNSFDDLRRYWGASAGGRVLELGCGVGIWTRYLTQLPLEITSMDISEELVAIARRRVPSDHVQFMTGDAEALPFPESTFDYVCGLSVLHHLNLPSVLKEMQRVLKPGGKLWFSEPNMLNPQIMIQKNVPPIKRWLGDTPDETAFFRWPLRRELLKVGFREADVRPTDFLHPLVPSALISAVDRFSKWAVTVPGLREIAGSLLIHAQK